MSRNEQRDALRLVARLLEDPDNRVCADCRCKPSKWASSTLGIFLCIECSGIHRSLGTHISFVRSCTLDTWTLAQARLMAGVGNKKANEYWEAKLPEDYERPGSSNQSMMSVFIKQKYVQKTWAADSLNPPHMISDDQITLPSSRKHHRNGSSKSRRTGSSQRHSQQKSKSLDKLMDDDTSDSQPTSDFSEPILDPGSRGSDYQSIDNFMNDLPDVPETEEVENANYDDFFEEDDVAPPKNQVNKLNLAELEIPIVTPKIDASFLTHEIENKTEYQDQPPYIPDISYDQEQDDELTSFYDQLDTDEQENVTHQTVNIDNDNFVKNDMIELIETELPQVYDVENEEKNLDSFFDDDDSEGVKEEEIDLDIKTTEKEQPQTEKCKADDSIGNLAFADEPVTDVVDEDINIPINDDEDTNKLENELVEDLPVEKPIEAIIEQIKPIESNDKEIIETEIVEEIKEEPEPMQPLKEEKARANVLQISPPVIISLPRVEDEKPTQSINKSSPARPMPNVKPVIKQSAVINDDELDDFFKEAMSYVVVPTINDDKVEINDNALDDFFAEARKSIAKPVPETRAPPIPQYVEEEEAPKTKRKAKRKPIVHEEEEDKIDAVKEFVDPNQEKKYVPPPAPPPGSRLPPRLIKKIEEEKKAKEQERKSRHKKHRSKHS